MADARDSRAGGIGVSELLAVLDGSGLRLASRPSSLRLPLTSPTLFDPLSVSPGPHAGILLGIGVHPTDADSPRIVRDAARRGFGAVIVKSLGLAVDTLAAVADAEGVALLVVDDELDWRQVDALVASALTSASEADSSLSATPVGDLFALANAIAAMIGGATAIEDLQTHILAYSTVPGQVIDADRREGILGRRVPDLPENAAQYASVFRAPGAVRVPGLTPGLDRLAVAVRAGAQPLGSIWVVDAAGDLDVDAERALERAADMAGLHLLRARSTADLARQQRAELLRRLLEGGDDSRLLATQLGLDPAGPFVVLAFQPELAPAGDEIRLLRLIDLIAIQCEAHQPGSECVVIGTTIYALFGGQAGSAPAGVEAVAERVVARSGSAFGITVRAAIGSSMPTLGGIARSRHDADLVLLLVGGRPGGGRVASARDARSQLTLLELAQVFRDTPRLVSPVARRILESDAGTGTEYARTLRTYLDCSRDSAVTAGLLSVHQNTLRYRLRRARELFGVDLGDPDGTLTLWLSLRVAEFD
ncbi:DNA-binding PucR family transcriptional regulator [Cryobacterium sp. MP_M5]|uniref:PucR family transcriptional regulator n=1 Tax=unclassified Cryobacterium TaxID=2649013 RepID=UPI0018CA53D5|nr:MULTISPECIES: helix-turn-helix domain-containing protein [unclassified Cryobacterium]MBG6057944.1 DNA-binding PucR family transcriptional regulator [Cryobacterium sp. MP_M3]MEC5176143.1 DNA-binding PucR family transcriptional regulator [Cryobacterium sp. MP_M5]